MLDAIICPDWESRYFSFNANWDTLTSMGSMRNGEGDDWFIVFGSFGAAIKGFAHETMIAGNEQLAREVQVQVPQAFASFLSEAAFEMDKLNYCYWRATDDACWQKVAHPDSVLAASDDGSATFLAMLIEPADCYHAFARWYFELEIPIAAIQSVYDHLLLTEKLVHSLNPNMSLTQALEAALEIGYVA